MTLVVCPGSLGTSAWVVSACPYLSHTGGRVCCNVLSLSVTDYVASNDRKAENNEFGRMLREVAEN
jgi:hypothetical protein